ncbi:MULTISPECIES: hypothetical protein [unclassified Lysobacter]|uniref:hypothetical protein n=1 Tax=unclassified Lysobacter TaxID=2635362 RepID=UPI001C2106C4|nr:hypothetical protein [Lysobacter sp. MMG2]MBU8975252.1 hypothetical protein [Lysobacter sp. MMG2]
MAVISNAGATRRPGLWGTGSTIWIWALLALAVAGFWPSYVRRIGEADAVTHLHAALMMSWFAMLFVQPWLVRTRRLALHRQVGKFSYALVPAIVLTCLWLSRIRMAAATPQSFGFQTFILYLAIGAATILLLSWALAIYHRRDTALHARYMVGTTLTLLDPALARLLATTMPGLGPAIPLISFGLLFLILGVLIWRDRGRHGQSAFIVLTVLFAIHFALMQVLPRTTAWQDFARGWGGLAVG